MFVRNFEILYLHLKKKHIFYGKWERRNDKVILPNTRGFANKTKLTNFMILTNENISSIKKVLVGEVNSQALDQKSNTLPTELICHYL